MPFTTLVKPPPGQSGEIYEPTSMRSYNPAPTLPCDRSSYDLPVVTRHASNTEIYGLTLGTCFLVLLMGWLLIVGIRTSFSYLRVFTKKPNDVDRTLDPESGIIRGGNTLEWQQAPGGSRSFLSNMRKVSAEMLAKSAQRKSGELATGLRDMDFLRRLMHPTHILDEEAALGVGDGENDAGGSFLRRTGWTVDVLSAQKRK